VVHAVFNKAADAGGIREDDLEKMRDRVDMSQLRIVGHTDYYPNWPMFATPTLSKDTRARIKSALLKLKSNEALFSNVLRPAGLAGFSGVSDSDYDQLREAAGLAGAW
jgi:phosphonate transport system substrate-binding protein